MLPAIKLVFTDTLLMTDKDFYVILASCFGLGLFVGLVVCKTIRALIKRK